MQIMAIFHSARAFARNQLRDAWSLVVAPGIAALVPWRLGYGWLRWLSRHSRLYDEALLPTARAAAAFLGADEAALAQQMRLVALLDHCDLYLSLLRRSFRLPWHVRVEGEWPRDGAYVATGFHYGTGHFIFSTFRAAGQTSTALYAKRARADYRGAPVRYWYGGLRIGDVERVSGQPGVFRPHIRKLLDALRDGVPVTALADIPPRLAEQGQRPVRLLDRPMSLPEGLVKLARSRNVPLVPFWTEFDLDQGTRTLVIGEPIDSGDVDAALQILARILDERIRAFPAAWMFWAELPRWVEDAHALHVAADPPAQAGDAAPAQAL